MLSEKKVAELKKLKEYITTSNGFKDTPYVCIVDYINTRVKQIDTFKYVEYHVYFLELKKLWWNYDNYNSSLNSFMTDILLSDTI